MLSRKRPSRCVGKTQSRHPAGVAVVELAICLPVLVVILLATIEACVMLQLKQNLAVTAYEGARIGILPGTDESAVQTQCQLILDDRGIEAYNITISPDPTTTEVGDLLTVTVAADCEQNSVLGAIFYEGQTLSETVIMRTE